MRTILAIDDKMDNLTTIDAVIKNNIKDCSVLKANSGAEGIRIAKESLPDTIILDIIMPDMDGYAVCEILKKDKLTKHIPVLLLTAIKTDSASRVAGLNAGAEAFLSKPIDTIELIAQVNVLLRIKAAEDELRLEKANLEEMVSKRTRELRKALAKAEESDKLKSAFLANMSHEIRTPMNGILGFTSLLMKPALTGEKQLQYIHLIQEGGKRMLNILNDLIDISRIEAGQVHVNNSRVDINKLLDMLFSFFHPEAEKKGLKLSIKKFQEDDQAIIETDKEKLSAILSNLIKNAIKYTNTGSIELGYSFISNNEPGECSNYEFYVVDTGIGIPEERQAAIFDRFVQGDNSTSKAYEGAGLGLAISKAYVELLGGDIAVESKENEGSRFYFNLPECNLNVLNKEDETGATTIDLYPSLKDLTILIVDDDESALYYLEELLGDKCKKIITSQSGEEAIELCSGRKDIDVILMDVRMHIMDGYATTRKIREFDQQVIIIAQTASALSGDREKALDAGCNEHVTKPIDADILLEMIEKLTK